ncbi:MULTISPECIES: hypothetical protein [Streptomyces]|uniref:Secreted protein n=1 Tax=Streptomyces doebereineriae TaxID=3075528 RepID=A0ABU2VPS6_9ACTN|nr:hypothetical protein [Streptomyces sp. DSM 41640]MDT0487610.1 hypothetical protein [Streptomyces sp. DSM 41640]
MNATSAATAGAVTFVWLGMVLAISFLDPVTHRAGSSGGPWPRWCCWSAWVSRCSRCERGSSGTLVPESPGRMSGAAARYSWTGTFWEGGDATPLSEVPLTG